VTRATRPALAGPRAGIHSKADQLILLVDRLGPPHAARRPRIAKPPKSTPAPGSPGQPANFKLKPYRKPTESRSRPCTRMRRCAGAQACRASGGIREGERAAAKEGAGVAPAIRARALDLACRRPQPSESESAHSLWAAARDTGVALLLKARAARPGTDPSQPRSCHAEGKAGRLRADDGLSCHWRWGPQAILWSALRDGCRAKGPHTQLERVVGGSYTAACVLARVSAGL
jgi:hypothetical protein